MNFPLIIRPSKEMEDLRLWSTVASTDWARLYIMLTGQTRLPLVEILFLWPSQFGSHGILCLLMTFPFFSFLSFFLSILSFQTCTLSPQWISQVNHFILMRTSLWSPPVGIVLLNSKQTIFQSKLVDSTCSLGHAHNVHRSAMCIHRSLYQDKIKPSLASTQRPGHWTHNYQTGYYIQLFQ